MFKKIKLFLKKVLLAVFQNFKEIIDDIISETGLKEKNLESFLSERGVSELIKYKDYYKRDDKDCGIYLMSDNSKAIILRITVPVYVSGKTEDKLTNFFSSIDLNNTVVQFLTFASRNIEKHIKQFEDFHSGHNVKVDNPKILKNIIKKRAAELRRWTKESMSRSADFKIKDFHNLVAITFPDGTEDEVIYKKFDEMLGMLGDFNPINYSADELLTIISEMFYFDKEASFWDTKYDDKMEMNHQLVSGGVEFTTKKDFKGFKANDSVFYRTLTTKSFPSDLSLFDYNNAFFDKMGVQTKIPISTSFLIGLTLRFDDVEKRKEKVLGKLNHDIGELSKLRPIDLKKRPDLKQRLKETEQSINLLREENEVPIKGMWTLTIIDTDEKQLNEQCSSIKQRLSELGWELVEEESNNIAFMTFLYSLPGMFSEVVEEMSKRFRILFKSNHASMAPIIGDSLGVGDYNIISIGRSGQIQRWDPFAKGAAANPNIIKAGGSGSGKSFSEAEFQSMSLSAGYLLRIIDAGGSYEFLCKSVGGQYIEFGEDVDLSLNFFTKANTIKNENGKYVLSNEEVTSMASIIGLMGGVNLAHEFRASGDIENITKVGVFTEIIMKSINIAFERAGHSAKLEDVRDIIIEFSVAFKSKDRNVSEDLENFASSLFRFADTKGPFYKYFNPPNNVDLKKDYVVIETQELLNISNDLFVVVVAILTNQIKNEFFDLSNIAQRKILTVDEAKPILDNPISLELLIQIYRKIRKYNGLANTITQSINDFYENDNVQVLAEIAGWKWFLKQNDGVIDGAVRSGRLNVGGFEKRLLNSLKNNVPNYGEYYLSSENVSVLSRLKVDMLSYWTYTTDGGDKAKAERVSKEHDMSLGDSRMVMALVSEGKSIEKALEMVRKDIVEDLDENKILSYCTNLVSDAISNPSLVKVMKLDVFDKETKEIFYSELFAEIENDFGIENGHLYKNRSKIPMFNQYDQVVLDVLFGYISKRNGLYSINISIESISDDYFVSQLVKKAEIFEGIEKRVVLEIPIADIDKTDNDVVDKNIQEVKSRGYRISNDNLKHNDRILNILRYNLDFIKIAPDMYIDEKKNIETEIVFSALNAISEKTEISIIATRVETKEEYEKALLYEHIKYVQGFYLSQKSEGL